MSKVYLKFYGCQANLDDGSILKGILTKNNFTFIDSVKEADIIIIGTCIVKSVTSNKILNQLKEIYKLNKKLIIAGCMPESETNLCKKLFPRASLINTYNLTDILDVVDELLSGKITYHLGKKKELKLGLPKYFKDVVTIQISSGCNSNCSFCETKLAKGYIQSYPEELIIKEIKNYIKKGIKKFNISSTNNSDYGIDIKTNLPSLIKKIISIDEDFKIRIGMMNPKNLLNYLDELVEIYKDKKIIKFIHIPIQSGSDKVLKDMNRGYKIKDFIKIVDKFKKEIPGINISTDIIVGYPTENQEDFNETIDLIKKIKPEVLNISKFGARPGTVAAKLKSLKSEIVKERSVLLTKEYKNL
ncbi:MAG: tRNA (N(6)-L-threonylcarbamoyladenosine(37)-C(2))-methylthiotransferase [Nanoarchaeota archaeon]|nr:tRNA (N(6)-L-threonylcarbamoyladenosine(37)-C(2))-methylthiotransferase [Nanoarchaeota archaeon]MBU0963380.1 tRNA (N(6)-L-threonylcarbamoyladenosine(37)-C(2))-methylthiotransferase [Nanoarchaeota archaeon]